MKKGAPSKWTNDKKSISLKLAEQGKTDKEICEIIGISESSFTNYKREDPDFLSALRTMKESFDSVNVENALLRRAIGLTLKEVTTKIIDGKKIVTETIKEIAPDSNALALYLRNRLPQKYCVEKQNINFQIEPQQSLSREEALQILRDDPFANMINE